MLRKVWLSALCSCGDPQHCHWLRFGACVRRGCGCHHWQVFRPAVRLW